MRRIGCISTHPRLLRVWQWSVCGLRWERPWWLTVEYCLWVWRPYCWLAGEHSWCADFHRGGRCCVTCGKYPIHVPAPSTTGVHTEGTSGATRDGSHPNPSLGENR